MDTPELELELTLIVKVRSSFAEGLGGELGRRRLRLRVVNCQLIPETRTSTLTSMFRPESTINQEICLYQRSFPH